jgi:PAS domain S-box-containing protein
LRQKQTGLYVVALSFLLVLTFFVVIALGLIQPAFQKLEQQQTIENIGRVKAGIEKQIEKVKQINQDWSNWDDTALYTQDKLPAFISTNLEDFGFQEKNIGLNLCFIFDNNKQLKYSQLWETDLGGELPVDPSLASFGTWVDLLVPTWKQDQTISGLVKIDSFPVLLSVSPIYNSSGSGPGQGWLIFGHFLDKDTTTEIIKSTQIPFSFDFTGNTQKTSLSGNNLHRIETFILNDISEKPLLEIEMPIPDTIPNFQKNLFMYMLFAFAIILLFFVFIYAFFTKKMEEVLHQEGSKTKNSAYNIVLLVILAGLLFSFSLFWFLRNQNNTHLKTGFTVDCQERIDVLQKGEDEIVPDLQWLRRVFVSSPAITQFQFSQFSKPLLQTKPFCSLSWVRHMNETNYPVTFFESNEDTSVQVGTNLYTNANNKEAMDKARDSGLISSTQPVQIIHGNNKYEKSTIFLPVYTSGYPQTIAERRKQLKGFIVANIHIDLLFKQSIQKTTPKGLPTKILNTDDSKNPYLVYTHIPRLGSGLGDQKSPLKFVSIITLANRKYQVEIVPNVKYTGSNSTSREWVFLLFSLIITFLFAIYLFRTLTQKDQAELLVKIKTKEVSDSKERYRSTLQSIGDGVIAVDSGGCVTGLNPVAETLTGWSETESIGKSFEDIFHIISASTGKKVENPLIQALKNKKVIHLSNDTTLINKKGVHYQIADSAAPILDTQGKLTGAVMVFHDVSSEYAMKKSLLIQEEQLKAQNILLQELMGKKDELLSIAAHDIRSPLTVIKGYADLLLMYSKDTLSSDQVEMIGKIQSSTKFIIQLLNDLLDFSALESGKVSLDKQAVEFESYMKAYIVNTVIVAHQKSMEIESDIQKDLPLVSFDPMKIQQVLNNLTSNAIKFSNPGSNILISVKTDQKFVFISVKDRGQGIPESEIPKLFAPFQKTSVKSTGGEKSTGLGLVIARNIVRAHGGEMYIESEVGHGSTFTFTLPL